VPQVCSALEAIGLLTDLESFMLKNNKFMINKFMLEISSTEVRDMLHDTLGPGSSLKHVDIHGTALRLVDGEWVEVSSSVA
jgi:hypothetical protein